MKIGRTIITVRREGGHSLQNEVENVITDVEGVIRPIIATMGRRAAKDFLEDIRESEIEKFHASIAKLSQVVDHAMGDSK